MDAKQVATMAVVGTVVVFAAGMALAPAGGTEQQAPPVALEAPPTSTTLAPPTHPSTQVPTTLQELVDLLATNVAFSCRVQRPAAVRVYTGITREAASKGAGAAWVPGGPSQNVIVLEFEGQYAYYAARGHGGPPPTGTITITANADTFETTDLSVTPQPPDLSSLGPGEMIATT